MLVLDSTSKSIVAVLTGAVATNQPHYVSTYADSTSTTFVEGSKDGVLNGVTEVTIVSAPAASTYRVVRTFNIYNADTASVEVTVEYVDSSDKRTLCKVTLLTGETLQYHEGKFTIAFVTSLRGPGTSTDNALARWDGATGNAIQNSTIIIDDSGNVTGVTTLNKLTITQPASSATLTIYNSKTLIVEGDSSVDQDLTSDANVQFNQVTVGNTGLVVGSSTPFSDSSGTLTLQNIDALDATTESTLEAAIDTLANLTSIQGQTISLSGGLTVESSSLLNQDLTSDASPIFVTVKLSSLTDGYIPYHISDASGLGDSPLLTDGTNVGLTGTIGATTGIFVNLADGYIPYHISDASGLGDSPLYKSGNAISGPINITITTHAGTEAVDATTMYGNLHRITGAFTVTVPAAVVGMSATFRATTAVAFSVDCNGADHFELFDGTALTAGHKITSGGTKNEFVTVVCESANTWIIVGINGVFTDGG